MSDSYNCAILEVIFDSWENHFFGAGVNVRSSFIDQDHLWFSQDSSSNAEKLLLTRAQVISTSLNLSPKAMIIVKLLLHLNFIEDIPDILVSIFIQNIKIFTQRSIKKHGILRNNSDLASKIIKSQLCDINPINQDCSLLRFNQSQQREESRWFSGTCPTNDANLFSGLDLEIERFEHIGKVRPVFGWVLLELNFTFAWPGLGVEVGNSHVIFCLGSLFDLDANDGVREVWLKLLVLVRKIRLNYIKVVCNLQLPHFFR